MYGLYGDLAKLYDAICFLLGLVFQTAKRRPGKWPGTTKVSLSILFFAERMVEIKCFKTKSGWEDSDCENPMKFLGVLGSILAFSRFRVFANVLAPVARYHFRVAIKTFVFKVLRNGLLRYILHTCPKL